MGNRDWKAVLPQEISDNLRDVVITLDFEKGKIYLKKAFEFIQKQFENKYSKEELDIDIEDVDEISSIDDFNYKLNDFYELCNNLYVWIPLNMTDEEEDEIENMKESFILDESLFSLIDVHSIIHKKLNESYINNKEDIIDELGKILKTFQKELNPYQTDVYIYFDENGNGELDTFINVGGNSWINDDHKILCSDKQHNEQPIDYFSSIDELSEALGMTNNELINKTKEYIDDDNVDYSDIYYFVTSQMKDEIQAAYEQWVDSLDFYDIASNIIADFEDEMVRDNKDF